MHGSSDMRQGAQFIYDSGMLGRLPEGNVTLFYPVAGAGLDPSYPINQTFTNAIRYHFSSQLVEPQSTTVREMVVSTYLISPNNDTLMSDGTSQKVLVSFDTDKMMANYGYPQRAVSRQVYSCKNGYIYILETPMTFPTLPSTALAMSYPKITFGSSNVSAYLDLQKDITFFSSADSTFNTIDALKNNLISGIYYASDLKSGQNLTTVSGRSVSVLSIGNSSLTLNNYQVTQTIPVWNGVVHVIGVSNSTVQITNSTTGGQINTDSVPASAETLSLSAVMAFAAVLLAAIFQL